MDLSADLARCSNSSSARTKLCGALKRGPAFELLSSKARSSIDFERFGALQGLVARQGG